MADHNTAHGGHPAMDYPEHERTYRSFVTFTKWGSIVVVGILIFMALFLINILATAFGVKVAP